MSDSVNPDMVLDGFDIGDSENLLMEVMETGVSRKQLHALPENLMEGFYRCAYEHYEQGKLDLAERFFKFLFMYDLYNADYAFGLGAVYQLKKQYQRALDIYAVSFALSKTDYRAMFEAGQCNMQLRYVGRAKKCFELVVEHEQDVRLVEKSKMYLESINSIKNINELTATEEESENHEWDNK
ncbi:SycD/LcrH family type III secretion system chaperone [Enterobacter sp. ENT03]|uniref:SycD/LcrH family type III secretion system chaperone n=1 Tax=Enterobacter sp. ENT03 TaxID=2854780 RepID=UPI001C444EBC|nr:SycD/LcrH family type III secretion system chaperone [Enterobacter sp. ENT03]MBV7405633.1 SycD/LcrH family type III secretion system chaperone [Enterobacter sp. ENT03]